MDSTVETQMPWFGRTWANVVAVGAIWVVAAVVVALVALALVFLSGGFAGTGVWAEQSPVCETPASCNPDGVGDVTALEATGREPRP